MSRARSGTLTSPGGRSRTGTLDAAPRHEALARSASVAVAVGAGSSATSSSAPTLAHIPEVDRPLLELQAMAGRTRERVDERLSRRRGEVDARLGQARAALAPALDPLQRVAFDPLQRAAARALDAGREFSEAEARRAEKLLRERFGGLDDSQSSEKLRAKEVARLRALFDIVAAGRTQGIPVGDLEGLRGAALRRARRDRAARLRGRHGRQRRPRL
jgi:hypothetical protein